MNRNIYFFKSESKITGRLFNVVDGRLVNSTVKYIKDVWNVEIHHPSPEFGEPVITYLRVKGVFEVLWVQFKFKLCPLYTVAFEDTFSTFYVRATNSSPSTVGVTESSYMSSLAHGCPLNKANLMFSRFSNIEAFYPSTYVVFIDPQ